ncbi:MULTISPECIES: OsmC family protein [Flavobacterium]|jgi:peroxiredoxin-like protein|uniref:Peroxiredoxin-like protein n=1 Tax=Flavobacterium cheniae TaxID=295428 RepID=A0A562KSN5_9FLAO|nr:OsmC family protein [Flavobacterium cheniae]TDR25601.1 peroxiredoxin-like protein [Flavobacterium cheniae]TWH98213.1 peroxiredoxin-like protein [Flavobacterium cheniae]
MEKHSYNLSLEWTGDRKGILSSPEFPSTVEVVTPPEFDKGIAGHWSPEHLFTASVLSCFMTTFLAIADYSKLEYEKFECKAEGILESIEGKFLMTEIILKPIVYIKNQEEIEKTERILHKSEKACLISNSIISNVVLDFEVKVV